MSKEDGQLEQGGNFQIEVTAAHLDVAEQNADVEKNTVPGSELWADEPAEPKSAPGGIETLEDMISPMSSRGVSPRQSGDDSSSHEPAAAAVRKLHGVQAAAPRKGAAGPPLAGRKVPSESEKKDYEREKSDSSSDSDIDQKTTGDEERLNMSQVQARGAVGAGRPSSSGGISNLTQMIQNKHEEMTSSDESESGEEDTTVPDCPFNVHDRVRKRENDTWVGVITEVNLAIGEVGVRWDHIPNKETWNSWKDLELETSMSPPRKNEFGTMPNDTQRNSSAPEEDGDQRNSSGKVEVAGQYRSLVREEDGDQLNSSGTDAPSTPNQALMDLENNMAASNPSLAAPPAERLRVDSTSRASRDSRETSPSPSTSQNDVSSLKATIEAMKQEIEELEIEKDDLGQRAENAETGMQNLSVAVDAMTREKTRMEAEIGDLRQEIESTAGPALSRKQTLDAGIGIETEQLERLRRRNQQLEQELQDTRRQNDEDLQKFEKKFSKSQEELTRIRIRGRAVDPDEDDLDPQETKKLMSLVNRCSSATWKATLSELPAGVKRVLLEVLLEQQGSNDKETTKKYADLWQKKARDATIKPGKYTAQAYFRELQRETKDYDPTGLTLPQFGTTLEQIELDPPLNEGQIETVFFKISGGRRHTIISGSNFIHALKNHGGVAGQNIKDKTNARTALQTMVETLRKMKLLIKVKNHDDYYKGFYFDYPKDGETVRDIRKVVQEKTQEPHSQQQQGIKILQDGDEISESSQLDSLDLKDNAVFIVLLASLKGVKRTKKEASPPEERFGDELDNGVSMSRKKRRPLKQRSHGEETTLHNNTRVLSDKEWRHIQKLRGELEKMRKTIEEQDIKIGTNKSRISQLESKVRERHSSDRRGHSRSKSPQPRRSISGLNIPRGEPQRFAGSRPYVARSSTEPGEPGEREGRSRHQRGPSHAALLMGRERPSMLSSRSSSSPTIPSAKEVRATKQRSNNSLASVPAAKRHSLAANRVEGGLPRPPRSRSASRQRERVEKKEATLVQRKMRQHPARGRKQCKKARALDNDRKSYYAYGNRNLMVFSPSQYPNVGDKPGEQFEPGDNAIPERLTRVPAAQLQLQYVHGYCGKDESARMNVLLSQDCQKLIYYVAGCAIVMEVGAGQIENGDSARPQQFFTLHNDDITCVAVDPKSNSTLVATGQTDPADNSKNGKDLPKIFIWSYDSQSSQIKAQTCIEGAGWGKIQKLQFSPHKDLLYSIGGDDDNPLSVWDLKPLSRDPRNGEAKLVAGPNALYKDNLFGFKVNKYRKNHDPEVNKVANVVDEIVVWGRRRLTYIWITKEKSQKSKKTRYEIESKGVIIGSGGYCKGYKPEKAFLCAEFLHDGSYVVGAYSGKFYRCVGTTALSQTMAHQSLIGDIISPSPGVLITAGWDGLIKRWEFIEHHAGSVFRRRGSMRNLRDGYPDEELTPEKKLANKAKDKFRNSRTSMPIKIEGSDMEMKPRAMTYDHKQDALYVGTRSCHIIKYVFADKPSREEVRKGEHRVWEDDDDRALSIIVDGHDDEVWALAVHPRKNVYLTGGYDNAIKIWDANTNLTMCTYDGFEPKRNNGQAERIVCAAWSHSGKIVACGTDSSKVFVFKLTTGNLSVLYEIPVGNVANKTRSGTELAGYRKKGTNWDVIEAVSAVAFSKDDSKLAVAHMDGNLYLFTLFKKKSGTIRIRQNDSMWEPMRHVAAPTHIQFSDDGKMVKCFTRDYEVVHWKLEDETRKGEQIKNIPDPDEVKWHGDPLIAGWDTRGLLQPEWDGTDLNACSTSKDKRYIASADDFGTVRLHSYPALVPKAHHEYHGHSSFVVGCKFLPDSTTLVTLGGADMGIFQWRLVEDPTPEPSSNSDEEAQKEGAGGWVVADESSTDENPDYPPEQNQDDGAYDGVLQRDPNDEY